MSEKGLFDKYRVTKKEGETDPSAVYFVLRLDTDQAARSAAMYYASSIGIDNPLLYEHLRDLVKKLEEENDEDYS